MEEYKIKHRRGEITLTQKDKILFNQACYQLLTQTYRDGWSNLNFVLSSTTCEKLIKNGVLIKYDSTGNKEDKTLLEYYKLA
jgi:hypothetical protein